MSRKILLVDDETNIVDVCKRYLEREGFRVISAKDGVEALGKWKSESPDLLVLDLMMPEKDGWKVCEEIRNVDDVPIMMLTARGEEADRLLGFTIGAEDYITKPFSPRELVLRVKSIFRLMDREIRELTAVSSKSIVFNGFKMDPDTRTISVNQQPIDLTLKEFDLLWMLASHPKQVFSRNQLLNQVWDLDFYGDTTTVTVHIRRLREKIETSPSTPRYIKTVWGIGYKFETGEHQ